MQPFSFARVRMLSRTNVSSLTAISSSVASLLYLFLIAAVTTWLAFPGSPSSHPGGPEAQFWLSLWPQQCRRGAWPTFGDCSSRVDPRKDSHAWWSLAGWDLLLQPPASACTAQGLQDRSSIRAGPAAPQQLNLETSLAVFWKKYSSHLQVA